MPMPLPLPAELLHHTDAALLLDQLLCLEDGRLAARLVVRSGTAFSDSSGNLPCWVGPEIMAQAIAALSGYRSLRDNGRPAAIGLLLGVRSYQADRHEFTVGDTLDVEVVESLQDDAGRAVFDCRISHSGATVASGALTVFQPPDDSFLAGESERDD
jgi:predicted hotdog family 3-hydroxylacyl-ACP dehydratase